MFTSDRKIVLPQASLRGSQFERRLPKCKQYAARGLKSVPIKRGSG